MNNQQSSHPITINLGPTFGSDLARVRNGQISWLDDIEGTTDPIFTLEIPLELADVVSNTWTTDPTQMDPTSLEFTQRGDVTVQGIQLDPHTRDILSAGGGMSMSVDSLSRSILLTDVDERTFIDKLQARTSISGEGLDALRRKLLVPALFDVLDDATATQTTTQLKANIRAHEREHVRCLIEPSTALWRELELYWCSVLTCTKSRTWRRPDVLNRLAALYGTPSRFTAELLAIFNEPYAIDNPAIERAADTDIATQRGIGDRLLQFLSEHNIDPDAFAEVLRSPEGEQFCDLWLAYVLDHLRFGGSLNSIDASDFHDLQTTAAAPYDDPICDPEFRSSFIDFIRAQSRGPVFELVRLKFVDDEFVLERAWYSLNNRVSAAESLVAVRRVLARRQLFPLFAKQSGLEAIRAKREDAITDIIQGASFDETSLFDISPPDPSALRDHFISAHETVATALLGSMASEDDLHTWLNESDYGVST